MKKSKNELEDLFFRDEVYEIVESAITVYNNLGFGFLEAVYQEALEKEFRKRGINFESQKTLKIYYQGEELSKKYIADLVYDDKIIIELKAETGLTKVDYAQLINYLKATGKELGVLINFGNKKRLEWERYIFTNSTYLKKGNVPNE
ncbi:MAG: GxxExxY protein [Methanocorpusculum sp.]|nr:GxxExxY protein [Methanocorpusculum sp.]